MTEEIDLLLWQAYCTEALIPESLLSPTKFCCKCKRHRVRHEFSISRGQKDGLQVYCRECMKLYQATKSKAQAQEKKQDEIELLAQQWLDLMQQ